MKRADIKILVLRVGGTNCDKETSRAFLELGVTAEIAHVNELVKSQQLLEYDALVFPGGFSYGDYVRAGAIWAKSILTKLRKDLKAFVDEGRLLLGICNGFQVFVEAGLLPGFNGVSLYPEAALAPNVSGYNCRWVHVKHENCGRCAFTGNIVKGQVLSLPIAHGEGRFMFPRDKEERFLKALYENDQMVFRYCDIEGEHANGAFPANPNGSFHDIAGICNPEGTIFGLMPHPERAFYWWQQPDWTRRETKRGYGNGRLIFESMIEYLEKKR